MNATDVLEVVRESIIVTLKIGGPIMIISLVVGLVISLFQALTPIARMVVAGGDLPAITPMALQHSDLDDPGANLG